MIAFSSSMNSPANLVPTEVSFTYADSEALERDCGFKPSIGIREGLRAFAEWYKSFYMA